MTGAVRVVADDNEKRHFTKADMERQLRLAEVNHCLSFEQVSDELIEDYNISDGTFDTVAECRYTVPSFTSIGRLYQGLVLSTMKNDDAAQAILDVLSSFNRTAFQQRVLLLLDNALEYSPEGGEISLTAHPVEKLRLLSPIQWTQRSI